MKKLFGALSFAFGVALMEHAFIQMADHKDMFRLDSFGTWLIIAPLLAFGIYSFFSGERESEANG